MLQVGIRNSNIEKPVINDKKSEIQNEKSEIDDKKSDIQKYKYNEIETNKVFRASDVRKILNCSDSTAMK